MSREFPDFIDPWRAAESRKRIGGTIPLARFKRLQPMLASDQGEATFDVQFEVDAQRRATILVEVSAPLELTCQRSLQPYTEQVRQRSRLQVIGEPGEQELLSEDEEFVLVEEGQLSVADLVEDELLLAVPQVPRNPAVEAVEITTSTPKNEGGEDNRQGSGNEGAPSAAQRQRPFESLAELLKNK